MSRQEARAGMVLGAGGVLGAAWMCAKWAARQGQAIRARVCQSVPLPAGTACQ
jgi:hypothetical protein